MLVLKDSYANSFVPFLAQHYRKIVMVDPRYYFGNLEQLIQVENVQEILYLYNANTFFADTSLELALSNDATGQNTDNTASASDEGTSVSGEQASGQDTNTSDNQTSVQDTDNSDDQSSSDSSTDTSDDQSEE